MRDFISESIKDLSIGFIVGLVIALLIEERASIGAAIVFFIGAVSWFIALSLKALKALKATKGG